MITSYNISKLILKLGKVGTSGEDLILPAVKDALEIVLSHSDTSSVMKNAPLSNDTVRRRIDEMVENVEAFLCKLLMSAEFSLQVDKSNIAKE